MNNVIRWSIFKHKSELMGMAICMILFFHSEIKFKCESLNIMKNICDIGVDIFMLLSGFSLANSYYKNLNLILFYKKRLIRIVPTYLVVFSLVYFYDDIIRYNTTIGKYLYDLFCLNFFIDGSIYIWFIPVIIVYYILLPLYVKLYCSYRIVGWLPYILIIIIVNFLVFSFPIKLFFLWVRMHIFLIGINLFLDNEKNLFLDKIFLFVMAICAIVLSYIILYNYPVMFGIKYFLYIPIVLWIISVYKTGKIYTVLLTFLGGITLELYLLHERIQWLLDNFVSNQYILCLLAILLSIVLATILHKGMSYIFDKLSA